ncbi:choice-of-anchor P family protein [Amycolatopsis minnesotensis]|uniref:choice-of-anchor P family protein n=1 Tax=Amycolatopsis minnesotensis TaxID=337894 RepID=UPI003CD0B2C0
MNSLNPRSPDQDHETVVIGHITQPAPNTTVNLGAVSLILNEQIPFTNPDNGLTVNAIHIKFSTLGLAKVNIVVASAESDINHCS